jgi:hypothetical protein
MQQWWHPIRDKFIPGPHNEYRPHILGKKWLVLFLTITLTVEGVLVASLMGRGQALNFLAAVLPGEIIGLTNVQREDNNLGDVAENSQLDLAAQAKAQDMAAKGYFSHVGPDGKEPWAWVTGAGYVYQYAGENLAVRFNESTDVVNAWMASPTHRANIVKPIYTEIGVGVAQGYYQGQPATFVVQYFGTPQNVAVAPPASTPVTPAEPVASEGTGAPVEVAGTTTAAGVNPAGATPSISPRQGEPTPQAMVRNILNLAETTPTSVFWILAGITALIIVALALAFFIHLDIQSGEMLAGGAVVAVIALAFIFLNSYMPFNFMAGSQSATVELFVTPPVLVGEAASTVNLNF